MITGNDGDGGDLFSYPLEIKPKEIDSRYFKFEGEKGDIISVYQHSGKGPGTLVAQYNHAFPSAHFDDVGSTEGVSQSNKGWAERQILQHVLSRICGAEYRPNEAGKSFKERVDYEQKWRRQQC